MSLQTTSHLCGHRCFGLTTDLFFYSFISRHTVNPLDLPYLALFGLAKHIPVSTIWPSPCPWAFLYMTLPPSSASWLGCLPPGLRQETALGFSRSFVSKEEEEEKMKWEGKREGKKKGGSRTASGCFLPKGSRPRAMGLRVRIPGRVPLS